MTETKYGNSNNNSFVHALMLLVDLINAQERIPCWAEKISYTYYPCIGKQGI